MCSVTICVLVSLYVLVSDHMSMFELLYVFLVLLYVLISVNLCIVLLYVLFSANMPLLVLLYVLFIVTLIAS
jgi:hypothetical protein